MFRSVKYLYNIFIIKTSNIYYRTHFEISFSNTFDTFKILCIFYVLVMGKLDLKKKIYDSVRYSIETMKNRRKDQQYFSLVTFPDLFRSVTLVNKGNTKIGWGDRTNEFYYSHT